MILSRLELKINFVLSLQVTCNVSMVAKVKALLFENLLDSKYIFLQVLRHFVQIIYIFVERNHLNNFDQVNEIT